MFLKNKIRCVLLQRIEIFPRFAAAEMSLSLATNSFMALLGPLTALAF